MKIINVLCSENIIRDAETGNLTIYNLIDDVPAGSFPFLFPRFSIYFLSEKAEEEGNEMQLELSIYNNDQKLYAQTLPINFNGKTRNRGVLKFNGVAINSPGNLFIKISYPNGGELLFEKTIPLKAKQNVIAENTAPNQPV